MSLFETLVNVKTEHSAFCEFYQNEEYYNNTHVQGYRENESRNDLVVGEGFIDVRSLKHDKTKALSQGLRSEIRNTISVDQTDAPSVNFIAHGLNEDLRQSITPDYWLECRFLGLIVWKVLSLDLTSS